MSVVALRDKFFAFFVASSTLPSNGICTRANYPGSPLKLRQNLLRRRIEGEGRGEGACQATACPSGATTRNASQRSRTRLQTTSASRARRYVTSATSPRSPSPPPLCLSVLSPSILRYTNSAQCFAMERELASFSFSSCFTSLCPACLAHSDSTERGPASGAMAEERARGRTGEPENRCEKADTERGTETD